MKTDVKIRKCWGEKNAWHLVVSLSLKLTTLFCLVLLGGDGAPHLAVLRDNPGSALRDHSW